MKPVKCHLESKAGTPLCMLGPMCERQKVTCGHASLRSARAAARKLAGERIFVLVVRGPCPAYEKYAKEGGY